MKKLFRKPHKKHVSKKDSTWSPIKNFGDKRQSWLPGCKPPNPKGRPPTNKAFTESIRLIGDQPVPESVKEVLRQEFPDENFDNMTYIQAVMFRNYRKAIMGDEKALEFMVNRTEGLLTQSMKLDTNNRNALDDKTKAMLAEKLAQESKPGNG